MDNPLAPLHQEIEKSIDAGIFFSPIFLAAALPDICAAMQSENGKTNARKYRSWFCKWADAHVKTITAEGCYQLRCGLLHQGRLDGLPDDVSRIIFSLPTKQNNLFAGQLNDAYFYSIGEFCADMIKSTNDWFKENQSNPSVIRNSVDFMRIHPNGFGSYVWGMPVIA